MGKKILSDKTRREEREGTALRADFIQLTPNVDVDKKIFLEEYLKVLAYADMYYKQREYTGFYNCALLLSFLAIYVRQFILAEKVYSLFG